MFKAQLSNLCYGVLISLLVGSPPSRASDENSETQTPHSIWSHSGSTVFLVVDGALREFHYQQPREGMRDAGAHEGSLLFKGTSSHGRYSGTAYLFNRRCGQIAYQVSGPILDNSERVLLHGKAPRVGANCQIRGYFADTLEFRLVSSSDAAGPVEGLLPPEFMGVWLDASAENKICKAADWDSRSGLNSSIQLVRVTDAALQGWEFGCKFASIKKPTNHGREQEVIEVELLCSGEGGVTWNSSERWNIQTGANRKNITMVSLKTWNYRDNSGKPMRNPSSSSATSEFVECN
jgi:hypothetical protein